MSYIFYIMNEQKMVVELNVILKVFTSFYKSTNLTRLSERELRQLRSLILLCSSSIVHWYFTFFFQYVHLDNERIIVQWEMTTFLWIEKEKKWNKKKQEAVKRQKKMLTLIRVVIGLQAIALFSQFKGKWWVSKSAYSRMHTFLLSI